MENIQLHVLYTNIAHFPFRAIEIMTPRPLHDSSDVAVGHMSFK